ncbi:MAG: thioesterase family protein [Burkholderiales bacterium]|nr:MAG: thioesterase family protein [Burkholderiales bacterium]
MTETRSLPSAPHPLDAALALDPLGEHRFGGRTTAPWANMVGPFGGITAAVLLQAALDHPARLGDPLALTVNFAGPVADGAFEIDARPARTNRATQHWSLSLHQGDHVVSTASAVFAVRRDTWAAPELTMPEVPPAAEVAVATPRAGIEWANRYEMRFVEGGWPDLDAGDELPHSRTAMWIRDLPERPLDAPALAAISDAFYPRVFRRRRRFTPIGTVSITTLIHADPRALAAQGARPVLACARGVRFSQGFFEQRAEVWGDDGTLLASSIQIVYYRD